MRCNADAQSGAKGGSVGNIKIAPRRGGWDRFASKLYNDAGYGPQDMDFVQLYDDYPIMVAIQLQDLRFCAKGEVSRFLAENSFDWEGTLPLNTGGGQLSCVQAGIAGDGMSNRSLTPRGFQTERRDFWEGQKTYLEMSPFYEADKLTGALLMYHSAEDQNVGTAPLSSERMLHALAGLGKTASLYMYPYEDHGPATKETLLDQWARWTAWLDVYVKQGEKKSLKDAKTIAN